MGLKIVHWYSNFLHGGAVAYTVLGLAAAQSRQGQRVVVAAAARSRRGPLYEPMDALAEVEVVEWHPARTLEIAGQLVRLAPWREIARLRALEPDIVHVHGDFNPDNLWVSRLFRCPVVITKQGFDPVLMSKSKRAPKRVYLAIESLLLRDHVRAFHALCPTEAGHLAKFFPNVATYCVPQGPSVLVPKILPGDTTTQTAWARKGGFLFVGRLDVFHKGLDILLEAFEVVAKGAGGARLHLTLAGPDFQGGRRWLEHRATELGIRHLVQFTGALTGAQVGAALAAADIYVQLSRYEGFSLSVVEALLASKPAVLSDATGVVSYPEIASLPHVKTVPLRREEAARAMIDAAQDLPELTRAALSCHKAVTEFFSWDRVARLHLDQYMQLLHA
jgi:glycosyltransferase involved in cell wall biosynthesis